MNRPVLSTPVIALRLSFADGTTEERLASMADYDAGNGPDHETLNAAAKGWLMNCRRRWDHPQDPVTYTAMVPEGREDDARALLALFPTEGGVNP